jgi:hypothetical protein
MKPPIARLLLGGPLLVTLLALPLRDVEASRPHPPRRKPEATTLPRTLPRMLGEMMTFHPERITRMLGSHDPGGRNRDNSCEGMPLEGDWRTIFHAKGEGRIVRLWMNADDEIDIPKGWLEIEIELDGRVAYRGPPLALFKGEGPWKAPLVLDHPKSSGAYLSLVPFPYLHDARIRFKGYPQFYQVSYQQGPGASIGPSAEETAELLGETWWTSAKTPESHVELARDRPAILARGPTLVRALTMNVAPEILPRLRVRVGREPPFPASMLFGFATARTDEKGLANPELAHPIEWPPLQSALSFSDPKAHRLATRLPIPLRAGETLTLETDNASTLTIDATVVAERDDVVESSGTRFVAQYREQYGPGLETTFPVFEQQGPVQFVSLVDETAEGIPGNRGFMEGDEMIRLDGMPYPLLLGTGTEDYFNGGWYFWGVHTNPLSGLTRFQVLNDERGWGYAFFEHSMYRQHVLDPIAARSGMRFGFEAGETGAYAPIFFRTLALGYAFDGPKELSRTRFVLDEAAQGPGVRFGEVDSWITSPIDAERNQPPVTFPVRARRGITRLEVPCPGGLAPSGLLLLRTFDQGTSGQSASIRIEGQSVDPFFELYANTDRRLAQDSTYILLSGEDCRDDVVSIEIDARGSAAAFTESAYEAIVYR